MEATDALRFLPTKFRVARRVLDLMKHAFGDVSRIEKVGAL